MAIATVLMTNLAAQTADCSGACKTGLRRCGASQSESRHQRDQGEGQTISHSHQSIPPSHIGDTTDSARMSRD
jgi:hypothetical protein